MINFKENTILPSPTEALIESVEKFSRVKFPSSYKNFIINFNGIVPIDNEFLYDGHEYAIERFLSLLGDEVNNFKEGWSDIEVIITEIGERLAVDEEQLGDVLIPIAVLFAGDYVCLDFRNNEVEPTVCIWYHEQSAPFQPVTNKIANSFDEFLNMLK